MDKEYLYIDSIIDIDKLKKLNNLDKLKCEGLIIDDLLIDIINKLNIKEIYFSNCRINNLSINNLLVLTLDNCLIDNLIIINDIPSLTDLYMINMDVDLNKIPIIRKIKVLSLRNSRVYNELKLISMDNILELDLVGTNIEDISILVDTTLTKIIVDDIIIKKNEAILKKMYDNKVVIYNKDMIEVNLYS